jgi:hypothetical protein
MLEGNHTTKKDMKMWHLWSREGKGEDNERKRITARRKRIRAKEETEMKEGDGIKEVRKGKFKEQGSRIQTERTKYLS